MVVVEFLFDVVTPRAWGCHFDHEHRLCVLGFDVEDNPVAAHLDSEEDREVWADVPGCRHVPIDATIREHDWKKVARELRPEHVLEVTQIIVVGVRMHNVIAFLGMESILQRERYLLKRFGPVVVPHADVSPAIAVGIGIVWEGLSGRLRG